MATEYRVVDLETGGIDPEPKTVRASSPEKAAEMALGLELVRSGAKRDLRARVYCQEAGQPLTMVRLYTKVADRDQV